MKGETAVWLLAGFFIGVHVASFHYAESILLGTLIVLLLSYCLSHKKINGKIKKASTLFLIALCVGVVRMSFSDIHSDNGILDQCVGENFSFRGIVAEEPVKGEKSTGIVLRSEDLFCERSKQFSQVLLSLRVPLYPQILYGDELLVKGVLTLPQNKEQEGRPSFDYVSYLAGNGIYYQIDRPQVKQIAFGKGNTVVHFLLAIKASFISKIEQAFQGSHSALVQGLLLGVKGALGSDLQEAFRVVGLVHIIVLSGSNVTLIAQSIIKALSFLPRMFAGMGAIIGIILFALMTGASSTVNRASMMAILAVIATLMRREYSVARALFFAAFSMIFVSPQLLAFDPSFQLSFLATIGLIIMSPIIEKKVQWVPEKWGMREIFVSSLSTQIFITPFMLFLMGQVSIVALVVNLVVLPLVPYAMGIGFLAAILRYISDALSAPFSWLGYGILSFIFTVVEYGAAVPFASINTDKWKLWHMISAYAIFGAIWLLIHIRARKKRDVNPVSSDTRHDPPSVTLP